MKKKVAKRKERKNEYGDRIKKQNKTRTKGATEGNESTDSTSSERIGASKKN